MKFSPKIIPFLLFSQGISSKRCGWPGRPSGSNLVATRQGFLLPSSPANQPHQPGDQVVYDCVSQEAVLVGNAVRTCGEDGRWTPQLPECVWNLAVNQSASQSSTLWIYKAELAVDNDPDTCAWTPKDAGQRWWQLKLETTTRLHSVRVHLKQEPVHAFTVFAIQMMANNRTLYQPCGRYNSLNKTSDQSQRREARNFNSKTVVDKENGLKGSNNNNNNINYEEALDLPASKPPPPSIDGGVMVVDVECDGEDIEGLYVFIRDDRKTEEYLTLCEVEVFAKQNHSGQLCGDPELPEQSFIKNEIFEMGHDAKDDEDNIKEYEVSRKDYVEEDVLQVACREGFKLVGDIENSSSPAIQCQGGKWNSTNISCKVVTCPAPSPVEFGDIDHISVNSIGVSVSVNYSCWPGHVLWGVPTLHCQEGRWVGEFPSCKPLTCGPPPLVPNAAATLLNGTALYNDVSLYNCNQGYLMVVNTTSEPVAQDHASITCSSSGTWILHPSFTCVNASLLAGSSWPNSAHISINVIYSLLALLIALIIPLLLLYCCRRPRKTSPSSPALHGSSHPLVYGSHSSQGSYKLSDSSIGYKLSDSSTVYDNMTLPDSGSITRGPEVDTPSCLKGRAPHTPQIGAYNVTTGELVYPSSSSGFSMFHPSDISPSTLRPFSTSANTFKPFSYTKEPHSLPFSNWAVPEKRSNISIQSSLPVQFHGPTTPTTPTASESTEPTIDEAGYASLLPVEPLYEHVPAREDEDEEDHTYDDVPRKRSYHEYMNLPVVKKGQHDSVSSFPDLLEMVTKSPSPVVRDKDTRMKLYATVDMSKKRNSRPSSQESQVHQDTGDQGTSLNIQEKDNSLNLQDKDNTIIMQDKDKYSSHISVDSHNALNTIGLPIKIDHQPTYNNVPDDYKPMESFTRQDENNRISTITRQDDNNRISTISRNDENNRISTISRKDDNCKNNTISRKDTYTVQEDYEPIRRYSSQESNTRKDTYTLQEGRKDTYNVQKGYSIEDTINSLQDTIDKEDEFLTDKPGEVEDSYTRSLIHKFNNFLESSGQEVYPPKQKHSS